MTSASFGASGEKTGEMTGKSTRRDILYVVTHSIFFHYIEKNPPFWHHSCQSERTKINFKSVYKKIWSSKNYFFINGYAIGKRNLKILRRNWENEQDYYIDLLEQTKRDYHEETYGYYSCDEGLINILMKEKYLKKWIMKKKWI